MAVCATDVFAQDAAIREAEALGYVPQPYGFVQLQGGVGATLSRGVSLTDVINPTFSIGGGAMFTPVVGARLHFNAFQTTGKLNSIDQKYGFKYVNSNVDVMVNLANLFRQTRNNRFDLYLIGGVGLNYAWDNDEFTALANTHRSSITEDISNAWGDGTNRKSLLDHSIRAGLLFDVNLMKNLSAGLEVDINSLSDRFNARYTDTDDWMLTAQLSLTYKFGHKKFDRNSYATPVTVVNEAETNAAAIEAARAAEVERARAAEMKRRAEAEETARKAALARQEEAQKPAETAKVGNDEPYKNTVFFVINKYDNAETQDKIVEEAVAWLNKYPSKSITIDGYADKGTGTAAINARLAKQRANAVAKAIKAKGISSKRIKVASHGDTVQPYADNDSNRCVIIVGE